MHCLSLSSSFAVDFWSFAFAYIIPFEGGEEDSFFGSVPRIWSWLTCEITWAIDSRRPICICLFAHDLKIESNWKLPTFWIFHGFVPTSPGYFLYRLIRTYDSPASEHFSIIAIGFIRTIRLVIVGNLTRLFDIWCLLINYSGLLNYFTLHCCRRYDVNGLKYRLIFYFWTFLKQNDKLVWVWFHIRSFMYC